MISPSGSEPTIKDLVSNLNRDVDKNDSEAIHNDLKAIISKLGESSASDFKNLDVVGIKSLINRINPSENSHNKENIVFQRSMHFLGVKNEYDLNKDLEEVSLVLDEKMKSSLREFLEKGQYSEAMKVAKMMEPGRETDRFCSEIRKMASEANEDVGMRALEAKNYDLAIKAAKRMRPGKERDDLCVLIGKNASNAGKHSLAIEAAKLMSPGKERDDLCVLIGKNASNAGEHSLAIEAAKLMSPGRKRDSLCVIIGTNASNAGKHSLAIESAELMSLKTKTWVSLCVIIGTNALKENRNNKYELAIEAAGIIAEEETQEGSEFCESIATQALADKNIIQAKIAAGMMNDGKKRDDLLKKIKRGG